MNHPIRVLFLCDGNADRSQMAEGLLRALGGKRFEAYSAGIEPAGLSPFAVAVMGEIGIDISAHSSKDLNVFEDRQFDYVVTLCQSARDSCIAFPRDAHNLHWQCRDPSEARGNTSERMEAYRAARDELRSMIGQWLEEIRRATS